MTSKRGGRIGEAPHRPCHATAQEPTTQASVPDSDESINDRDAQAPWGHHFGTKQGGYWRICFQNVGGFTPSTESEIKLNNLRKFTVTAEVDMFAFTEHNTSWDLIPFDQRLPQRTRGWWENAQWAITYNRKEVNPVEHQPGGAGVLTLNRAAHRAQPPGDDPSGLGRWSWNRIRGKNGAWFRLVSLYHPCASYRPLSTYQQHIRGLAAAKRTDNPKDAAIKDLCREIAKWQNEGKSVIVATDLNDDVRDPKITGEFHKLGLVELLTQLHTAQPPATHQRGSKPIDGFFVPAHLIHVCHGGYLAFGDGVASDHRAIWLDIPAVAICPWLDEPVCQAPACRLQCRDPRVVDKYNTLLLQQLLLDQVPKRVQELSQEVSGQPTRPQQRQFEALDTQLVAAKLQAERHCRKLRMGNIPWCPEVTRSINRILFWKGILRRVTGRVIGTSVLHSRAKAGGIPWSTDYFAMATPEVEDKIQRAHKAFKVVKHTPDHRSTWIAGVIAAQAQAHNRSKASIWKQHNASERIRRTA